MGIRLIGAAFIIVSGALYVVAAETAWAARRRADAVVFLVGASIVLEVIIR